MKTTIGNLIEKEVRKQQWSIGKFAEAICCGRKNVYDIFKRSSIDILHLAKISEVLRHNFFEDLVNNPELVDFSNPVIAREFEKKRALSQFMEVMPRVLDKLGFNTCIVKIISSEFQEKDLPDFGLSDFNVTFTEGEWLADRIPKYKEFMGYQSKFSSKGIRVDFWRNPISGWISIDIKLDFKTEEEWMETMSFVKEECIPQAFSLSYYRWSLKH
ncbi:MAG: hypothetical protein J6X91_00275 [Bacteroidales bacterium]|nr:hypothetical protein [Bacteroidales bacterium]